MAENIPTKKVSKLVDGVRKTVTVQLTGDELAEFNASLSPPATAEAINLHRDRRIEKGSAFTPDGYAAIPMTGRASDQTVYVAMLTRAQAMKAAGVTEAVHVFRDAENTVHTLTPDQTIDLVGQAMTWFENVMKVSWAMKDESGDFSEGVPSDWTDDEYWP